MFGIRVIKNLILLLAISLCSSAQAELSSDNKSSDLDSKILIGCVDQYPRPRPLYHYSAAKTEILIDIESYIFPIEEHEDNERMKSDFAKGWKIAQQAMNNCHDCNKTFLSELYRWAAYIQYQLGDIDQAINYYKLVLDQAPYMAMGSEQATNWTVAVMLLKNENYKEALEYFERWEALCPFKVPNEYFIHRLNIYQKIGNSESEEFLYQEFLSPE